MINDRQAFLLQWLFECSGLFDDEVDDLGQPGDRAALEDLATKGVVVREEGASEPYAIGGFFPVVHA